VRLFRDPDLRPLRFFGWTWVVLAIVFIATGGKPYYLSGLSPLLIAAGATPVEAWLERGRRGVRRAALVGAFVLSALIGGTIALPVLPVEDLEPVLAMNEDVGETVGWPSFAEQVMRVRDGLPEGGDAVVFTSDYGQAGAIDRYGTFGLEVDGAYSGHNAYHEWGPPPDRRGPVVLVGFDDERALVARSFRDCTIRARIDSERGIDNEEDGTPIWVCGETRRPWSELWPDLERLG